MPITYTFAMFRPIKNERKASVAGLARPETRRRGSFGDDDKIEVSFSDLSRALSLPLPLSHPSNLLSLSFRTRRAYVHHALIVPYASRFTNTCVKGTY